MLPDTGIDDVKKQRNAEYAKHINDPVLSSLKMEGLRLLFLWISRTYLQVTHSYKGFELYHCTRQFLNLQISLCLQDSQFDISVPYHYHAQALPHVA
jgi:hypothetical protein